MNNKSDKDTSNQKINIKLLFVSLGLSFIFSAILKLTLDSSERVIGLIRIKWVQFLLNQFLHTNFFNQYHCIYMIIIGFCILLTEGIIILKSKTSLYYVIWSIIVIVLVPLMIIWRTTNGILLIPTLTWLFFTLLWLVCELYKWTISDEKTLLAKLTFIWGMLVAIMGFLIKG